MVKGFIKAKYHSLKIFNQLIWDKMEVQEFMSLGKRLKEMRMRMIFYICKKKYNI